MRILAIDTALEACSAAVLDTAGGGISAHESLPMVRGHAEALMPLIARVLDRAKIDFAELDRIAVTTGPGSFTGLRVGHFRRARAGAGLGQAGGGAHDIGRLRRALDRRRRHAAGGGGDRCAA